MRWRFAASDIARSMTGSVTMLKRQGCSFMELGACTAASARRRKVWGETGSGLKSLTARRERNTS
ncbi:MAG TPA: hypothetical protein VJ798_11730 [Rhizomicrobium sp.]|nr:hypothetical protein [Rhizomicrobium sp.]